MLNTHTPLLSNELIQSLPNGDDYRRLAGEMREVARQTRLTIPRNELLRRATNYARRAELIDLHSPYW